MNPGDLQEIEKQRQTLLQQLAAAETALRSGLHVHGFGNTARAHMERAMAHVCEAHIAINELKPVRSVAQLVEDLNRVQQVLDEAKRRNCHRI